MNRWPTFHSNPWIRSQHYPISDWQIKTYFTYFYSWLKLIFARDDNILWWSSVISPNARRCKIFPNLWSSLCRWFVRSSKKASKSQIPLHLQMKHHQKSGQHMLVCPEQVAIVDNLQINIHKYHQIFVPSLVRMSNWFSQKKNIWICARANSN